MKIKSPLTIVCAEFGVLFGVSIDENGLLHAGVYFDQVNKSQSTRFSMCNYNKCLFNGKDVIKFTC